MSDHTNGSRSPDAIAGAKAKQPDQGGPGRGRALLSPGRLTRLLRIPVRTVVLAAVVGLGAAALPTVASALPLGGISGTVRSAEAPGEPIDGAEVCLYEATTETRLPTYCEKTNTKGEYKILAPEASYKVRFLAMGYSTQWYLDESSWASARVVEVEGSVITGIDASMSEEGEGSITGRVTSAANGQGAGGVEACLESGSRCAETNANGEYSFPGVPAGSVDISFSPAQGCEEEQGEKIRCQPKSNYLSQSVTVKVRANQTTSVETALSVGGEISGAVTSASITHPPIAKIEVCAFEVNGKGEFSGAGGGCAFTNPSGQYAVSGLEGGSYKVVFSGEICTVVKKGSPWECPEVYVTQYYQGQPTSQKAGTVSVTTGANTAGINETLREAFPVTPASTAAPTLTGTPVVGQALTCSQGSWAHEPTYLVYQWQRNGTPIAGQAGATYTLQAADQGHSITCSVLAGNGAGIAGATSNAVVVPVPLALFAGVKVKGSTASVKLRCPGPGACSGVVKILARVVTGHGRHRKTTSLAIGSARFSIAAAKHATVSVRLTGSGARLLRKAGRRGLAVRIAGSGVKAHAATLQPAAGRKKRH